jgi:hypothetical protein
MGIYERVTELYKVAEQKNAEERARQQREAKLRRDASRIAGALHAPSVQAADGPISGWLIHEETLPRPPSPKPGQGFAALPSQRTVRYYLSTDGRIYFNGAPIEDLTNATMDAVEQYLAEIAVKNHLDPELFRNDDAQS